MSADSASASASASASSSAAPGAGGSSGVSLEGGSFSPLLGVLEPASGPIALRFDVTAEQIAAIADGIIAYSDKVLDTVASVDLADVSYANVADPLARLDAETELAVTNATVLKDLSPEASIREAGVAAQDKLSAYSVKSMMRVDVFQRMQALADKADAMASLSDEQRRYVERSVRDSRRLGLHLDESTRKQVETLKTRMSSLCNQFTAALGEIKTTLHFTKDELVGMPNAWMSGLKPVADQADGATTQYEVTLSYPHVVPILQHCSVEATRRRVEYEFNRRAIDTNVAILEELIILRSELAGVLGYESHASYTLETRMARSPDTVKSFLADLAQRLAPLAAKELESLKAMKVADNGGPCDFGYWDFRYYMHKEMEKEYNVDMEAIKAYFSLETVTNNMLGMYETIFGLVFEECKDVSAWHPEVRLFAVRNRGESGPGDLIGYFYLDLYPRDGKYGHAAVFPMISSCEHDGKRVLPVAAMVCNFTKPSETAPSLLTHMETVTYFHEFGHVVHHLCSRTSLHKFAGFSVEQDFVEAPSQMLENWCWEPETLIQLSGHHEDSSRRLPEDLAEKLAATRNAHAGLDNMRQIFLATFDQRIHSVPPLKPVDTAALLDDLHETILGIPLTPGTNFAASFGHLAGGYDAQYYGYMWSEVYAMDMFMSRFKADGLLNAEVGNEYRAKVLQPGGSIDGMDLLRSFLGRDPSTDAFLKSKGLAV